MDTGKTQKMDVCTDQPLIAPFEHIALAFSGGGFRAAAFGGGVLSYLNTVNFPDHLNQMENCSLLSKVRFISSASGGTIANALFALFTAENKDFGEYYVFLLKALQGEKLLTAALGYLNNDQVWKSREFKNRNMINSFALTYDSDLLFNGKTLESLVQKEDSRHHLEEVCFGATEFYTGLPFRQQVKTKKDQAGGFFYGNYNVNLDIASSKDLKLADILAASSCFPAGFEPIVFPDDFCHGDLKPGQFKDKLKMWPQTHTKAEQEFIAAGKLGLMDGGITDNQALESLMMADERRSGSFDFMLINDVGSYFMEPYKIPEKSSSTGWTLKTFITIGIIILLAGAGALYYSFQESITWLACLATILFLLPASFLILLYWLDRQLHSKSNKSALNLEHNFSEKVVDDVISAFRKTPLRAIQQMLKDRANSMLILNTDVFMKRIRQILYNKFYGSPRWNNRGKGNHIYDLATNHQQGRHERDKVLVISEEIQKVAQRAADMPTTLWFDQHRSAGDKQLAGIIACGQFTTCYNLLDYVLKLEKSGLSFDAGYSERLAHIKTALQKDWDAFNKNPFWLYNQMADLNTEIYKVQKD